MASTEHLHASPNMWEQVILETLGSKEVEQPTFDVYPIVGRIASGKKTIQGILGEWLSVRDRFTVDFSSAGSKMRQHQFEATGRRTMTGHFSRPAQVDYDLDIQTAKDLIDPANEGKILIPEGRLLGFISMKLQDASRSLGVRLPCNIRPILLTADAQTRYAREYEKLHSNNPSISPEQAYQLTVNREQGEDITFQNLYPELANTDLYDPEYKNSQGENVYYVQVDTTEHSAAFSARKIYSFIRSNSIAQPVRNR